MLPSEVCARLGDAAMRVKPLNLRYSSKTSGRISTSMYLPDINVDSSLERRCAFDPVM
jgi:hypothetical protein